MNKNRFTVKSEVLTLKMLDTLRRFDLVKSIGTTLPAVFAFHREVRDYVKRYDTGK